MILFTKNLVVVIGNALGFKEVESLKYFAEVHLTSVAPLTVKKVVSNSQMVLSNPAFIEIGLFTMMLTLSRFLQYPLFTFK